MATIKKRAITLSTGKVINLSGTSLCIGPTLEVGEGFTKNILGLNAAWTKGSSQSPVNNPYDLNKEELAELADFMIGFWMALKEKVRAKGIASPEIFRKIN